MTRKQPKPKTPKPVQAWACVLSDGTLHKFTADSPNAWSLLNPSIRVLIVPLTAKMVAEINKPKRKKRKERKK